MNKHKHYQRNKWILRLSLVMLVYVAVLAMAYRSRPPFSNEFGLTYGAWPMVPAWSRIPTYFKARDENAEVFIDVKSNAILIVIADIPSQMPAGRPRWSGKSVELFYPSGGWVNIGVVEDAVVRVNGVARIDSHQLSSGSAREIYAAIQGVSDAEAMRLIRDRISCSNTGVEAVDTPSLR